MKFGMKTICLWTIASSVPCLISCIEMAHADLTVVDGSDAASLKRQNAFSQWIDLEFVICLTTAQ